LHIGFLTSEYPDVQVPEGGLGNYTRKVALELVQRGHNVTVFVLAASSGIANDSGIDVRYISKFKFHWRFKITPLVCEWLDLFELCLNALRFRKAVLICQRGKYFDIVQTPNYLIPGYFLCRDHLFPVVCRCSSYAPLWRSAGGRKRRLTQAVADWMEAHLVSCSEAAYAPSRFIAETYERFEAMKISVIPTPLELSIPYKDDSIYRSLIGMRKYILYFGALNGIKGVDVLIKAARNILSSYSDLSIVFVGRNDPLPDNIHALTRIQGDLADFVREGRIIYSPSLPKSQLYPIVENALGVVMPSRVDNLPNACLEALSLGVPVIGTRDSSIDEIIVHGKTGFLAENGDPLSLQMAISNLLDLTPDMRSIMIQNIYQYTQEIVVEDRIGILLQFYRDVIDKFLVKPVS